MKYIIGKNRSQLEMFCLEESVNKDNEVRLIDLFVESLPLEEYGFIEENRNPLGGRPAYHPSALLKLYIYGYMNRMRSSNISEFVYNQQEDTYTCPAGNTLISTTAGHRGASIWNDKKTMGDLIIL